MAKVEVEIVEEGWDSVVRQVIQNKCVPMMETVAADANRVSGLEGGGTEIDPLTGHEKPKDKAPGYEAGTEGLGTQLYRRDYRATVITATNPAMHDSAVNNTLLNTFYAAEGA